MLRIYYQSYPGACLYQAPIESPWKEIDAFSRQCTDPVAAWRWLAIHLTQRIMDAGNLSARPPLRWKRLCQFYQKQLFPRLLTGRHLGTICNRLSERWIRQGGGKLIRCFAKYLESMISLEATINGYDPRKSHHVYAMDYLDDVYHFVSKDTLQQQILWSQYLYMPIDGFVPLKQSLFQQAQQSLDAQAVLWDYLIEQNDPLLPWLAPQFNEPSSLIWQM